MPFTALECDGWNPSKDGPYVVCHRRECRRRMYLDPAKDGHDPTYGDTSDALVVVEKGMQHPYCSVACLALEAVSQLAHP